MTRPGRASCLQTVRIVAWSLIGIRNRERHSEDQRSVGPIALMFTALGALVLFILALMALVHWVV